MNAQNEVSLFPRLNQFDTEELTLEELIRRIRRLRWWQEIEALRVAVRAGRPEEARRIKSQLPGFTPSGLFRGGHRANQLVRYSQIIVLDFDHVARLEALIACFRALPYTLALFVSPSGDGLKVFVRVDSPATGHAWAYSLVALFYTLRGGEESDPHCKDVSRCCYVSADPEAWYNPEARVFAIPLVSNALRLFLPIWLRKNRPVPGSRNQTVYRLACEANRRGWDRVELATCCTCLLHDDSFTEAEIVQTVDAAYQQHTDETASTDAAKGHKRTQKDTATFSAQPDPLVGPTGEEGEALREATPCFPEALFGELPSLLRRAVAVYRSVRERDMALLSAATVVSACLPGVWGVYHRHQVYPHLFTVGVAPAASGKSCLNDMRHLADSYAGYIEAESSRQEREYRQALEAWEVKKADAHRRRQPVCVADAPLPVATRYFFLPAQNTKAKLLIQLRDNGPLGGLMADSEIDTLVSANKQDFGLFDDLLRKAFHHEPIGAARKTDNEMIRIHSPRLAVLLSGTPGQFARLLPGTDNGLASRLLLYTYREPCVWQDVSPSADDLLFETLLGQLSDELLQVALALREKRMQVTLSAAQWRELNDTFARLLSETGLFGTDDFQSVVKRYGLITFRLCMVLTALDAAERGEMFERVCCRDVHFRTALSLATVSLEHSRLLMTQLAPAEPVPELRFPQKLRYLLDLLPATFTLQDVYNLAVPSGISERSVRRFIKRATPLYITNLSYGEYTKNTPTAPAA